MPEPTPHTIDERRKAPRFDLDAPAKVRLFESPRYQLATVVNLSSTGAMLKLHRQSPLRAGEIIELGLPTNDAPVIRQNAMPRAQVVRSVSHGEQTDVAVCFNEPQPKLVNAKACNQEQAA